MLFDSPENLVELNYTQPPHTIDVYRNMMCAYLGIMGEVIHNIDERSKDILQYAQTSTGKSRLSKSFYGQNKTEFELKMFTYELIDVSHECWTPGCSGTYFIFRINPLEYMVVFNIGYRERIASTELSKRNLNHLVKFIGKFLGLLFNGAQKVLLCGHSNGMVSATFTSVILMCLADPMFASELAESGVLTNDIYHSIYGQYDPSLFFGITEKICVCGTGGYPILFDRPELFDYYFKMLNGRYLHIGLGLKQLVMGKMDLWVDWHMRPHNRQHIIGGIYGTATALHNHLYHVYSYPYGYFLDTVRIKKSIFQSKYDGHINRAEPSLVEYEGINAATSFFEDYEYELHMFNFYRVLLTPVFCVY